MVEIIPDPAKFITRGKHEQHMNYAPWLAHAFEKLIETPIGNAQELVEFSAKYMRPSLDWGSWNDIEKKGRERAARMRFTPDVSNPAAADKYGIMISFRDAFSTYAKIRGYEDTYARLYPREIASGRFDHHSFSYRIPDTTRRLSLMQVGSEQHILPDSNIDMLVFRHPVLTGKIYKDFIACLQPLFNKVRDKTAAADEREEAAYEFYWLMAQMTPLERGGSAHARLTFGIFGI